MHLALEMGFVGILIFLVHFLIHGMVWEGLKMIIKHTYRKCIGKKCEPECKYDEKKKVSN